MGEEDKGGGGEMNAVENLDTKGVDSCGVVRPEGRVAEDNSVKEGVAGEVEEEGDASSRKTVADEKGGEEDGKKCTALLLLL